MMDCYRALQLEAAEVDGSMDINWIEGKCNGISDAISRNDWSRLQVLAPNISSAPSQIRFPRSSRFLSGLLKPACEPLR